MKRDRMPMPGQLYNHFKNKLYQVITVATHADTREEMVVYQALYGDYKCYIRPLDSFLSEVDHVKYPEVQQKYRFELWSPPGQKEIKQVEVVQEQAVQERVESIPNVLAAQKEISYDNIEFRSLVNSDSTPEVPIEKDEPKVESVNEVLLKFLDAESFYKKLEVITSNRKHMNDRLINDMAVSLDCAVDEGPLDQRIQGLITCLQAMCRFEDKRLR